MVYCPICSSSHVKNFFHLKNSPLLQNVLFETEIEAKSARNVDVNFLYCSSCHFVFNSEFHEMELNYNHLYNNNQMESCVYREYLDGLADDLIKHCGLSSQSRILEIGCGNGYFLSQLHKKTGNNENIRGYDPSYNDQYNMGRFIKKEYFTYDNWSEPFDLIIFRHCFESLLNYSSLFNSIRPLIKNETSIFIEITNLDYIISNKDISMLYHECHRYYSSKAITFLLGDLGFIVKRCVPLFDGQYLGVIASLRPPLEDLSKNLGWFYQKVLSHKNVLIWGISGRAISVLTHFNFSKEVVKYGVDIDKNKQGKFIPVTGQLIISPEEAVALHPDLIIIANRNYVNEISALFPYRVDFLTIDSAPIIEFID